MDKFEPNTELYGQRIAVYPDDDEGGEGPIITGHLEKIIDPNTFVVDGRTFYTDQSDNFDPTQKPMALFLATEVVQPNIEQQMTDKLEPLAIELLNRSHAEKVDISFDSIMTASMAISLKRIADAVEKLAMPLAEQIVVGLQTPINNYGEAIGEAIQGQIERGMRGINPHTNG